MAVTVYTTNDPLAVKLWSKKLFVEALKQTWLAKFMGSTVDSLIQIKDEATKGPGDKITYGLRMQLQGRGVQGDSTLEGNEEALSTYTDALVIDQLRHAVRANGRMSQQRVPYSLREEAMSGLRDWWADRIDFSGFNQLCGNVPAALIDTKYTGLQTPFNPDIAHYMNAANAPGPTGLAAPANSDADVATTTYTAANATTQNAVFTLGMIDRAKERAKIATPAIRPLKIKGKDFYVMFLHPTQVTDLRTNTQTGQWLDIQKAAMTGGEVTDNPIFDGSLGVYNGVILHEDVRVPNGNVGGVPVLNTRRAVFCGAQAAVIGYGRENGPEKFTWIEETFDYGNQFGVAAGLIWGMKKVQFNGMDFATITMTTFAATH